MNGYCYAFTDEAAALAAGVLADDPDSEGTLPLPGFARIDPVPLTQEVRGPVDPETGEYDVLTPATMSAEFVFLSSVEHPELSTHQIHPVGIAGLA